jgi:hypothetical protein
MARAVLLDKPIEEPNGGQLLIGVEDLFRIVPDLKRVLAEFSHLDRLVARMKQDRGAVAPGLFFPAFRDQWDTTNLSIDLDAEDMKGALFTDTVVPDFGVDTAYGVAPWNANETNGGSWPAGGVALTTTALSNETGTVWTFDAADVNVATTTITSAMGYLLYDDTNVTVADAAICLVDFVTAVSTSNGTFEILWTAPGSGGIFNIDLVP